MSSILRVNASQPQHTEPGRLVGTMYYGSFLTSVLSRDEYGGYPHNGGEHTLRLYLNAGDLHSFLALVRERFAGHPGVEEFVRCVYTQAGLTPPPAQLH